LLWSPCLSGNRAHSFVPSGRAGSSTEQLLDLLPTTDEQLVSRIAGGDASALEQLYDRYVRQCFGLAMRLLGGDAPLAEEVVQEVFLKVWSRPTSYSPEKGHFISWLLSLVHHRCIDELRRRSRTEVALEAPETGSVLDTAPDPAPNPGERVVLEEQRRSVRQALAAIPPEQRQLLELAYYRGLSQSEIAARVGQPLGTVKTRMRSGLRHLRSLLEEYGLQRE
jgi:RNA polymerase sigma-70 factor, ECF subfamily